LPWGVTVRSFGAEKPPVPGLDFAWGRVDLREAAANGGLSTVEYADYHMTVLFGIWGKYTIRAYRN